MTKLNSIAMLWVRSDIGIHLGGYNDGGEKWQNSGCNLKAKEIGFIDGLNIEYI